MKILAWIIGIIVFLFTIVYISLFSNFGNSIASPYIEKEIRKLTKLDSKLLRYRLSLSEIDFILEINKENKVRIYGDYSPFSRTLNLNYVAQMNKLSTLEPLIQKKLIGKNYSYANIVGDISNINIIGRSKIAMANTTYKINIQDLKLKSLIAKSKNLDLKSLANMFGEKSYIDAKVDLDINLNSLTKHQLLGNVKISSSKASFNKELIKKDFGISMPNRNLFRFNSLSTLKGDDIFSKIDFNSKLVHIKTKELKYNTITKAIESDYDLYVPSLNSLYFLTHRKIKGNLSAYGIISKSKNLDISIFSKVADAKIVANLHNTDLTADIKMKNTAKTFDKLYYPKIINATMDARLKMNIAHGDGNLKSKIKNGVFSKNKLFKLVKDYAKLDMYKESFVGNMDAKIDRERLLIDLDLFSEHSSISTKKTKLNIKTKQVNSLLTLESNTNALDVKLSGDVSKPNVELQMKNVMIKKILDKYLK